MRRPVRTMPTDPADAAEALGDRLGRRVEYRTFTLLDGSPWHRFADTSRVEVLGSGETWRDAYHVADRELTRRGL